MSVKFWRRSQLLARESVLPWLSSHPRRTTSRSPVWPGPSGRGAMTHGYQRVRRCSAFLFPVGLLSGQHSSEKPWAVTLTHPTSIIRLHTDRRCEISAARKYAEGCLGLTFMSVERDTWSLGGVYRTHVPLKHARC